MCKVMPPAWVRPAGTEGREPPNKAMHTKVEDTDDNVLAMMTAKPALNMAQRNRDMEGLLVRISFVIDGGWCMAHKLKQPPAAVETAMKLVLDALGAKKQVGPPPPSMLGKTGKLHVPSRYAGSVSKRGVRNRLVFKAAVLRRTVPRLVRLALRRGVQAHFGKKHGQR